MTDQHTLMDPADFRAELETAFEHEPAHAGITDDLARGRRSLRRRRVGVGAAALATAAVVAGAAVSIPALGGDPEQSLAPASGGSHWTDQQILDGCIEVARLGGEMLEGHNRMTEDELVAGLRGLMASPELMTSATTPEGAIATVRSGDGQYWEDCHLEADSSGQPGDGYGSVYPTGVGFPRAVVDGQQAYEPVNMADPRLEGTASGQEPQYWVPKRCSTTEPEETEAWYAALAACDVYTVVWNDRRVPEVDRVKLVTPDGTAVWADARNGYVSLSYTAPMIPEVAESLRSSKVVEGDRIVFYDDSGDVLVSDPGGWQGDGPRPLSIAHYPSLAYWLR